MKKYLLLIVFIFYGLVLLSQVENSNSKVFIPEDIVIAHRGTTFWAPEETEAAYIWARDIGADYLEVDIQRSKDGVLLALHDVNMQRTTNIKDVYPDRKDLSVKHFSFKELMKLDAGSWFNKQNPKQAKKEFSAEANINKTNESLGYFNEKGEEVIVEKRPKNVFIGGGQGISTLEDVIRIAEGYRIAKDESGNRLYEQVEKEGKMQYKFFYVKDKQDKGNRPGVYIETKEPRLFPNVEQDLYNDLDRLGWNVITKPSNDNKVRIGSKVNIANTSAKVILQTFSIESLKELHNVFKDKIPVCLLLWLGDDNMEHNDSVTYHKNLKIAKKYGAQIIGPSIAGEPNNYSDLLTKKNFQWIKQQGFIIHPYSFDTKEQMEKYGLRSEGMFTNRADLTIKYYQNLKN